MNDMDLVDPNIGLIIWTTISLILFILLIYFVAKTFRLVFGYITTKKKYMEKTMEGIDKTKL